VPEAKFEIAEGYASRKRELVNIKTHRKSVLKSSHPPSLYVK